MKARLSRENEKTTKDNRSVYISIIHKLKSSDSSLSSLSSSDIPTMQEVKQEQEQTRKSIEELQAQIDQESKIKKKEIKNSPITLRAGKFSCSISRKDKQAKYFISKEFEVKIKNTQTNGEFIVRGGVGNKTFLKFYYGYPVVENLAELVQLANLGLLDTNGVYFSLHENKVFVANNPYSFTEIVPLSHTLDIDQTLNELQKEKASRETVKKEFKTKQVTLKEWQKEGFDE